MQDELSTGLMTDERGRLDRRLAAIVEFCDDAIISVSLKGIVTSWNHGASKLFGYSASDIIGQPILRLIPEERHAEEEGILSRISQGETVRHFETQRLRSDGHTLDISLTVSPIKDENGLTVGASKVARDITRRKRVEQARRELIECSRLLGRPFFDAMVGALAQALDVRWVLLCDIASSNPSRARTLAAWSDGERQANFEYDLAGTPCANVLGEQMCFFPADVASLFPDDSLLSEMGADSYLGVPLRGSSGRTLGLLAVLDDKPLDDGLQPQETLELFAGRAAAELERITTSSANERLGRIVEDAASETFVFDASSLKFVLVNRGARENLGYIMDELRELTPLDIKPKLSMAEFTAIIEPLKRREKAVQHFKTVHRRKDGTDYNVSVALQLLEDEARPVFYAAIEDTTDRDAAVRDLEDVSRRLDTILNNTTMAVFMMDGRQECIYMNPAAERLTGYSFHETVGRPLHEVIHHTHPDGSHFPIEDCSIDRAFPEDNQVQGEGTFVHKNGSFYPVAYTASPIRDVQGTPVGTVVEVRNIAAEIEAREALVNFNTTLQQRVDETIQERQAVEAQLFQAQKMEAIGKLTGGIAHDFNNLLQVIGGNLQLLVRDVVGDVRAEQRVQSALASVARGGRLASQLLAFGRRQPLAPKVINLGRLVHDMDDLLSRAIGEGVELKASVLPNLWNTLVDQTQVENAILNLAINARDAMKGYGKLTIEAENAVLDEAYVRKHPDIKPGQYVMLAVTDTGCGIPRELIDKIFEPFFTTKELGKGTGLGLSMVYGLIKQSDGYINVYSELGEGTTIRVYLPRAQETEVIEDPIETGPLTGGTETVLVVEDDDDVRSTVVELLSELGYRVLRASNATGAMAIIESGLPIDLIFTDVVMPGPLQSSDMARRARATIPNIAVLFTSGYTDNSIVHEGRLDPGVELLSKPYTREALAHRVRHCLDRRTGTAIIVEAGSREQYNKANLSVLLVEDEILIRMVGAELVTELGHVVHEASSAEEALRMLQQKRFDVLITDIGLPGITGISLATQVREKWPTIRIIIASGYSRSPEDVSVLGDGVRWLTKPFDMHCLSDALS